MPPQYNIPCHLRKFHIVTIINVLAVLMLLNCVNGDVIVNKDNKTLAFYLDRPATFGPELSEDGITGYLVYIQPKLLNTSCSGYVPSPPDNSSSKFFIALILRNGCKFDEMVLQAQNLGYKAAIVQNRFKDDNIVAMGGDSNTNKVNIPSVFVGWTDGEELLLNYCYYCSSQHEFSVTLSQIASPDFKSYILWPFAVVVGTCFILMLSFMIFKWCRSIRKRKKSRLSTKVLKKIPTRKFKKGDDYDVCAICLDDYEEGDKLRILPCSHAYHCVCIDPWLTKNKKTCPVCKRKVIPGSNPDSDSDSDEESGNQSTSETAPLLGNNNNTRPARRSTFDNSGLPETVRPVVSSINELNQDSSDTDSEEDSDTEHVPQPSRVMGNVVSRPVINRGYFRSSDEDDDDDDDDDEGNDTEICEQQQSAEESRQAVIANVSIVNVDQSLETRNVNHVV